MARARGWGKMIAEVETALVSINVASVTAVLGPNLLQEATE
jgi:hypothetical protein